MNSSDPAANCAFQGGGGVDPLVAPGDVAALVRNHPCYSEEAHHHFARLHLPVAPGCNIQCHYCNRKFDCAGESRPGVTSRRLAPDEAVARVQAVAAEVPELSVVGIAGPGDPLANPTATFATLEGVRRVAPDLTLCLSTNGLALPDHVDRLAALGVRHVTVTVNMTDPAVGERIYPWIIWKGRRVRGAEASRILSDRQLDGIARLVGRGVLVKVNAVVIPQVNDRHLPVVVRRVRALGAFLVNLVPLISAPEHGTHYGLAGQRGPTPDELEAVRRSCAVHADLMRHCRQCRADAVGKLGQDRFAEFTKRITPPPALVAVATRGGGQVNQHFGHAGEFLVYEVSRAGPALIATRRVEQYCRGGDGEDDVLAARLRALAGCRAVLVAKVGHCPAEQLRAAGIEAVTEHAFQPIESALRAWYRGHALGLDRARAAGAREVA